MSCDIRMISLLSRCKSCTTRRASIVMAVRFLGSLLKLVLQYLSSSSAMRWLISCLRDPWDSCLVCSNNRLLACLNVSRSLDLPQSMLALKAMQNIVSLSLIGSALFALYLLPIFSFLFLFISFGRHRIEACSNAVWWGNLKMSLTPSVPLPSLEESLHTQHCITS